KSIHKEWNENHPDALKSWKPTDEEEIYSSDESVPELWSVNNGRRIVRSVMTENRFKNLLRFCRFDETTNTKAAQVKRDKEAAFRDIWTISSCKRSIQRLPMVLWSVNNGRRIVRSVMTENRFKNLLRF
ncbi:hypothetical protein D917_05597, partial [Trichinella nativa]